MTASDMVALARGVANALDTELRATPLPVSGTVTATPTGTQAVSAASLPLPTGAATQATLADVLTAITSTNTKLDALITAVGLLATAAAQTTGNTSLAAIQASTANLKPNGVVSGIIATVA